MNQRSGGPWALLTHASIYKTFQNLIRGSGFRERWVRDYLKPEPGQRVLDVGCGPAAILALLPEVDYTGVDFEPHYISQAKVTYAARTGCRFECMDVRHLAANEPGTYDLVMAVALLHHLDDDAVTNLISTAHTLLRPGGRFFTLDPALIEGQHPIARLLVSLDRGRHVRWPEAYTGLIGTAFSHTQTHVIHDGMKVPYTHCITVSEKT